ncbi:hypothetical protein B9G53_17465 [Pseudanabaena sp. SR411]|uniref:hypothetical protein n=1 Tax=Pseudanabaena sp. SR411 TaxID=1980935 RepID=UPI000B97EE7E|nr:hypothetical protein [Pseudanabaena sp. SR411]OYQ63362.1 hypothetical protein B9G53_17465 [Pseudanabaena sp. SR411]
MSKKAKVSKLLVIDASIARSCGAPNATFPTSKNCRDFLNSVLTICHRMVLTDDIKEEWDKHQSIYAKKWRSSMVAKRKVEYRADVAFNQALRDRLDKVAESDRPRETMWKDCHLLEAAIATDKIVVSLDEKARNPFDKAAKSIKELHEIMWVNPDKPEENALVWLENGATIEKSRQLGQ